jgi:hypothetical protein
LTTLLFAIQALTLCAFFVAAASTGGQNVSKNREAYYVPERVTHDWPLARAGFRNPAR